MKSLVIIPTFNEAENIAPLIARVRSVAPELKVLIIDDASNDGTAEIVKEIMSTSGEFINIIERPGKLGLGTAYVRGFQWAIEQGFDNVIEMDADFSHNPDDLPVMLSTLEQYPVAIGSRYVLGGGTHNWGLVRRLISRFGSLYSRLILGVKIRDMTGGFNGWQIEVLRTIKPETITSEGYSFQVELKYRALLAGFPIKEFPIIFVDRVAGTSKMSARIVFEAMLRVWQLRFNASFYRQSSRQGVGAAGR